jgi:hypothetical protein
VKTLHINGSVQPAHWSISGFPNEFPSHPALPGPSVGGEDSNVEPGSRDFMLKEGKRGRGILPPPGKDQPLRDDVLDKITIDDLDELYTDDGPRSHNGVDVPPGGNGFAGPFVPGGFGGLFGGAFGPALPFHGPTSPFFGPQNREVITQHLPCLKYRILMQSCLCRPFDMVICVIY